MKSLPEAPAAPPCRASVCWGCRFMKVRCLLPAAVALLALGARAAGAEPASPDAVTFEKHVVPFLNKYCYTCHNSSKKRGEIVLDKYRDDTSVQSDRKVWDSVLHMVRSGEMPPKEKPRPPMDEIAAALRS